MSRLHEANEHKYHIYGPIFKEEYQWRKPVINIFDPKDFETVLKSQGKCPIRPPNEFVSRYRTDNKDKYPNIGLSNMNEELWAKYRSLLGPALMSLKTVQNHIPAQNSICDDFLDYLWQNRDQSNDVLIDLTEATYRLALESICMMCLDSRMHCFATNHTETSDGQLLIDATKRLFESYNELYYGIPFWKLFETNSYRKFVESETCIYEITSKYVNFGVNAINNDEPLGSVLQTLLKTEGLTEEDIKITIIDFIAGGIFTVSNTLSFLLYHLASNPTVQQKLYEEVNQVMADSDQLTAHMLSKMPYLKACVNECFRLNSPVPLIARTILEPIVLSGYKIPAKVCQIIILLLLLLINCIFVFRRTIFSHLMVTSRLSEYFEDPLIYRPERWLEPNSTGRAFALRHFGFGSRMCVGKRFSELELYLVTAKLIKRYQIKAIQPRLDLNYCFIIIPAHNISLELKLREK